MQELKKILSLLEGDLNYSRIAEAKKLLKKYIDSYYKPVQTKHDRVFTSALTIGAYGARDKYERRDG